MYERRPHKAAFFVRINTTQKTAGLMSPPFAAKMNC